MLIEIGLTNEQILEKVCHANNVATQMENRSYIKVEVDEFTENPLSWGWCHFFSCSKGALSDEDYKYITDKSGETYHISDFESPTEIEIFLEKNDYVYVRVCAYVHSGISLSESLSCPWDSGVFGYLYFSKADIRKELGKKRLSSKEVEDYKQTIRSMIPTLDQWLNGEVYIIRHYDENLNEIEEEQEDAWGYSYLVDRLEEILGLSTKKSA